MYCNFESEFNIPVQVIIPVWVHCTLLLQHNSLAFLTHGFANSPNLVYFTPTVVVNFLSQVINFLLFFCFWVWKSMLMTLEQMKNKNFLRQRIGHFTVMDGSEVDSDVVLIQTFRLYYVNQVILMLTSSFQEQFP